MGEPRIRVRRRRPGDKPPVFDASNWQVTCSSDECPGVAWMPSHQSAIDYATRTAAVHIPKHHPIGGAS